MRFALDRYVATVFMLLLTNANRIQGGALSTVFHSIILNRRYQSRHFFATYRRSHFGHVLLWIESSHSSSRLCFVRPGPLRRWNLICTKSSGVKDPNSLVNCRSSSTTVSALSIQSSSSSCGLRSFSLIAQSHSAQVVLISSVLNLYGLCS